MYDFKKLSSEKVKRLCSEAKIKSLSENDLAGLFGYVNSQLFRLNNARGLDAVMERQWWNAALALITEIKKVLSSNPPLYRPYMEEVRQQLQKRTVLLN